MSLNNIQLTSPLVIDLYKKTLLEIHVTEREMISTAGETNLRLIEYLGGNRKNISFVVSYPQHQFLPEAELDFLTSILKACRLELSDIGLVNAAQYRPNLEALKKQLLPEVLIIFGKDAGVLKGTIPDEFVIAEMEGIAMVCVPELLVLNQDNAEGKAYKKKLWSILKQLFKVT